LISVRLAPPILEDDIGERNTANRPMGAGGGMRDAVPPYGRCDPGDSASIARLLYLSVRRPDVTHPHGDGHGGTMA
jgi:hypothetical protein